MLKYFTERFILVCTFIFLIFSSANAQGIVEEQVRKAEGNLSAILENNNIEALEKVLHNGFTVQSAGGPIIKREQLLQGFRNGGNPYLKFRPKADSVMVINENTVITSGMETYAHKSGGQDSPDQTRFFYHVWIRYNNNWQLAGRVTTSITAK